MAQTDVTEIPADRAEASIKSPGAEKLPRKPANRASKRKVRGPAKKRVGRAASRAFPTASFQESLEIAEVIQAHAAGNKIRRLTLFDAIKKSPDSGTSRMLITNSSKYGLTTGGYQADYLELTPKGRIATDPEANPKDRLKARFELAIATIPPFKTLYDRLAGNKLPAKPVMHDILREVGIPEEDLAACADAFIVNAKYLGLLKTVAGAERLLSIEHVLEEMPSVANVVDFSTIPKPLSGAAAVPASTETSDWSKICFYITPIGADGSAERQHSDLFLNYIVEPAISELQLTIVRADQIGKPGMIGAQVVEHVLRSRLVIADLSFHNPNVFYELCLRHASGLPIVQIIRHRDSIPFDLQQFRTIQVDTTDIYSLVPKLEVYKSEIALQARRALEDAEAVDNPITLYFPGLKLTIPGVPSKTAADKVI